MGYYCYKRKTYSTHTSDVIVMLAVALVLLCLPWLFTREQVVVVEEKKTNWSALVTPILVLFILLLLSLIGTPRRVYAKPTCYRCKHVCYCYWLNFGACFYCLGRAQDQRYGLLQC
ncbi:hypothetical protein VNO80_17460 [Phaseolus coccineus]|uniref:Cytochrome b/b6 C-terminal region profile domain-containing protein n=1 Tax=Phaseolus coccineus TaxID=3886 RepID=A0AAN9MFT2_PHACN